MAKKLTKIFIVVLLAILMLPVFCGCEASGSASYMLSLNYAENFKIMQLADIQAETLEDCEEAFINIKKLVEKEKPNLIVLTGDNIYNPKNSKVLEALIENMESFNIPWAPVFGNHDATVYLSKSYMASRFVKAKHCLFASGEFGIGGLGNYVINLTTPSGETKYSLFLIDSNMYNIVGSGYDAIHKGQIRWYERAVNKITRMNNGTVVPSLAFFHIPLKEYATAKALYENGQLEGYGTFNEEVDGAHKNTGFFAKAKELGSTKAIFCGHDHVNNCCIDYQGIKLAYGLKSSRNDYHNEDLLGATIITLTSNNIEIENSYFD